ncbi:MAG: S-ribosylhomocysteine lyase [Muribaculaceae bacterium]|jgi:S-ribosylhomocysteine lyase|nr:S-ribosylhomocysteine lyase [Muribaculaceae bacterium]
MDKIASFTINHLKLKRGIYLSRKDTLPKGDILTTFDIRMKEPNREPVVSLPAIHTIEHLGATFLRNHPKWGKSIVYWGPMGCCTGCYLILAGDFSSADIIGLMKETFSFISDFDDDIPGATARDCGNYMLHNLPMAKWEAKKYLVEVLEKISDENLVYPVD